jgi:hypothetical protein
MNKNAQLQTADQTLKGAVLALSSYIAHKNNVDPQIIALSVPVAAGLMAKNKCLSRTRPTQRQ